LPSSVSGTAAYLTGVPAGRAAPPVPPSVRAAPAAAPVGSTGPPTASACWAGPPAAPVGWVGPTAARLAARPDLSRDTPALAV